jgi:hypothetical protein
MYHVEGEKMSRTFKTECEHCGDELTVDVSDDPGADAWSVEQSDNYCDLNCREEDW